MGDLGGLLLLDAAYAFAGVSLLQGLGIVRSSRSALLYLGLAVATGWAACGLVLSALLMIGLDVSRLTVAASAVAVAVAGFGLRQVVPGSVASPRVLDAPSSVLDWFVVGAGVALSALFVVSSLLRALVSGADNSFDVWAFWIPKARAIYFFQGLENVPGAGFGTFAGSEYPPLVPATEAAVFAVLDSARAAPLTVQHWLLGVAALAGVAALLTRQVRPLILWPLLGLFLSAPLVVYYLDSALADPQLALMLSLAMISSALWLLERDGRWLGLATVFLAAASLTKTEGFALALLLAVLVAAVSRPRLRSASTAARWAGFVLAPVAVLVPWKLWLASHQQVVASPLYSPTDLGRPAYLIDRLDRLTYALEEMVGLALSYDRWLIVVPLALAGALALTLLRSRLGVLVLAWFVLGFFGLASVYWISELPLEWYVDTSAQRVLLSLCFVAGTSAPLLAAVLERHLRGRRSPPASS